VSHAFETLDLRVGRIVRAEPHERARKASYKLAAVNLGARNVAGFTSEVLVLGVPDAKGEVVLLAVEREVPLGSSAWWKGVLIER
jgi:tRNA-binding protein